MDRELTEDPVFKVFAGDTFALRILDSGGVFINRFCCDIEKVSKHGDFLICNSFIPEHCCYNMIEVSIKIDDVFVTVAYVPADKKPLPLRELYRKYIKVPVAVIDKV